MQTKIFHQSFFGKVITATMIGGAAASACSTPPTDGTFSSAGSAGAGQGGETNGGAGGNGGMTSGSVSGGAGGNGGMTSGSASGGAGGSAGACTAQVYDPVPVSLGMYLMLDKSGSMQGQKWTDVTNAIKAFAGQPSADGIGIGLEFFPAGVCPDMCNTDADCGTCGTCVKVLPMFPGSCTGSTTTACDVNEYLTPAVAIANLPGIAPVIKSAIDGTTPSGNTPTSAALDGAIQYTKQWMTMNPNAVGVAIFATDGEPSECDTGVPNIYNIAAAGLAGTPSVRTYVIGVGTQLTFLDGLAAAGGTNNAFLIDANSGAQMEFLQAMNEIRGAALSCAYVMPSAPAGEMIDYDAVAVRYIPTNGTTIPIPHVASSVDCPANGLGWYYDGNLPPQQILLCPTACAQISADNTGRIDVLAGCVKP